MLVSHLTLTFSRSALLQQKRLGSPNNPPECRYYEVEKWNKINIKLKFYGSLFNPSFFSHTHDIESKSSTLYHVVKATTTILISLHPYRSSGRDTQHIYINAHTLWLMRLIAHLDRTLHTPPTEKKPAFTASKWKWKSSRRRITLLSIIYCLSRRRRRKEAAKSKIMNSFYANLNHIIAQNARASFIVRLSRRCAMIICLDFLLFWLLTHHSSYRFSSTFHTFILRWRC